MNGPFFGVIATPVIGRMERLLILCYSIDPQVVPSILCTPAPVVAPFESLSQTGTPNGSILEEVIAINET